MACIKQGDVVRASFATSGKVLRLERAHGQDVAVLDTQDGTTRKVPASSLELIPTCENKFITRDDSGQVTHMTPCQNKPQVCTRRGIWYCQECRDTARRNVQARLKAQFGQPYGV